MDFKSHALKLNQFLIPYKEIWRNEVMNDYPHSYQYYPSDWLELLSTLTIDELYQIDSKRDIFKIKDTTFHQFTNALKLLTKIEKSQIVNLKKLEPWAYVDVKEKKKHEINILAPIIKNLFLEKNYNHLLDIGGGVGHLSRILSYYFQIPTTSLDQNSEFQKIGKKRLTRYRKPIDAKDINFVHLKFSNENLENNQTLKNLISDKTMIVGLHTCGNLALNLIDTTLYFNGRGLFNFGCCYHKIKPEAELFNSVFYKENNFTSLNQYALTLATRAHGATSFKDFEIKRRVKFFRYGLHLFLVEHFNDNTFIDVGECPIHVYQGNFSDYAKRKLRELNLPDHFTNEYIDAFLNRTNIVKDLEKMFLCNLIRWQLGRALEIYLLLDRCLYLSEKNFNVTMKEYFEENVSPRNIGILATI